MRIFIYILKSNFPINSFYSIIFLSILFFSYFYVIYNMDRGVDISDGAYYVISRAEHEFVHSQSTLFGPLWDALSPFDGIWANRVLGAMFLGASFGFLAISVGLAAGPELIDRSGWIVLVCFASVGALSYYFYWHPDPSYNSMNLVFIALAMAGLFSLMRTFRCNDGQLRWFSGSFSAFLVGFSVACVSLAKATSALLLGPLLLLVFLISARSHIQIHRVLLLACFSAVGFGVVLCLLFLVDKSPIKILEIMNNGIETGLLIAQPQILPFEFGWLYLKWLFNTNWLKSPFLLIPTVCTVLALLAGEFFSHSWQKWLRAFVVVAACMIIVFSIPFKNYHYNLQEYMNVSLLFLVLTAFLLTFLVIDKGRGFLFLILMLMVACLVIYSNGTGNDWSFTIVGASGYVFVGLGLVLVLTKGHQHFVAAVPAFSWAGIYLYGAFLGMTNEPYRIEAPLNRLTHRAPVGPGEEMFYVGEQEATFFEKLNGIRKMVDALPRRPLVIDLTGRVPMVAYQIGGRVPNTPWLLSGYPGSLAVLNLTLSKLDQNAFADAWIFQSTEYDLAFPNDALEQFGVSFPEDYYPVTTVPVPYMSIEATLYAPNKR